MKYITHEGTFKPQPFVSGREWQSETRLFGVPLVHIAFGRDSNRKLLVAKGIIAIGQYAYGGLCISQFGVGFLCISQFSIAALSLAQFTIAGLAIAQFGIFIDGIAQFALHGFDLFGSK